MVQQNSEVRRRMQIPLHAQGFSGRAQHAENIVASEGLPTALICTLPQRTAIAGAGAGRNQRHRPVRQWCSGCASVVCRIPWRRKKPFLLFSPDQEHLPEE